MVANLLRMPKMVFAAHHFVDYPKRSVSVVANAVGKVVAATSNSECQQKGC